jgi:hypothetical protein
MNQVSVGVFRLGQIWSVVGGDGTKRGFTSRDDAVAAAHDMASVWRTHGEDVAIMVQDELGLLTTLRSSGD